MTRFVLALDQGTTGSTALAWSLDGQILGRATCPFAQHFPRSGWVEHEPEEIWQSVLQALHAALQQGSLQAGDCAAIGITNQRETTLAWRRADGVPLHRAIVWQDRRTAERCQQLRAEGFEELFRQRTGLLLDPYFSGTKMHWLLEHVDGARRLAEQGKLCLGTVDSYLAYRLTAGEDFVSDLTNASRTLLCDIRRGEWDDELLQCLQVPRRALPRIVACDEIIGETRQVPGLPDGIPIAGMAGDQHAALFGQTCFAAGDAKCTYGTGAFLLMNVGDEPLVSRHRLLSTVAWRIGGATVYALEGSAFVAGAAVQWLRDGLGLMERSEDIEALARQVEDSGGVAFVPALTGLGAPYWDPEARGLICGITRDTRRAHIARAALEGIALQVFDLANAMVADAGRGLGVLRVDGGAAQNDLLMQLQADLLQVPVVRPAMLESTALGAAYLAALGAGLIKNIEDLASLSTVDRRFVPQSSASKRRSMIVGWQKAIERTQARDNRQP